MSTPEEAAASKHAQTQMRLVGFPHRCAPELPELFVVRNDRPELHIDEARLQVRSPSGQGVHCEALIGDRALHDGSRPLRRRDGGIGVDRPRRELLGGHRRHGRRVETTAEQRAHPCGLLERPRGRSLEGFAKVRRLLVERGPVIDAHTTAWPPALLGHSVPVDPDGRARIHGPNTADQRSAGGIAEEDELGCSVQVEFVSDLFESGEGERRGCERDSGVDRTHREGTIAGVISNQQHSSPPTVNKREGEGATEVVDHGITPARHSPPTPERRRSHPDSCGVLPRAPSAGAGGCQHR